MFLHCKYNLLFGDYTIIPTNFYTKAIFFCTIEKFFGKFTISLISPSIKIKRTLSLQAFAVV